MSKVMGIFGEIQAFTMPAHQIWSCHVALDANFKKILFCPNSSFNIRKSHKISSGKALYTSEVIGQKLHGVWKQPAPLVPLGLSEQEGRKLDVR